jgi:hypothetical protein
MTDVLARVKAVLASTPTRWLNMTEVLPVDLLNRQPAAGAWFATECLIHLLDTEHIFPARVQAELATWNIRLGKSLLSRIECAFTGCR